MDVKSLLKKVAFLDPYEVIMHHVVIIEREYIRCKGSITGCIFPLTAPDRQYGFPWL